MYNWSLLGVVGCCWCHHHLLTNLLTSLVTTHCSGPFNWLVVPNWRSTYPMRTTNRFGMFWPLGGLPLPSSELTWQITKWWANQLEIMGIFLGEVTKWCERPSKRVIMPARHGYSKCWKALTKSFANVHSPIAWYNDTHVLIDWHTCSQATLIDHYQTNQPNKSPVLVGPTHKFKVSSLWQSTNFDDPGWPRVNLWRLGWGNP